VNGKSGPIDDPQVPDWQGVYDVPGGSLLETVIGKFAVRSPLSELGEELVHVVEPDPVVLSLRRTAPVSVAPGTTHEGVGPPPKQEMPENQTGLMPFGTLPMLKVCVAVLTAPVTMAAVDA